MVAFSGTEELYGVVATLLIAGEDEEAVQLLRSVSAHDLHELRDLAGRVRTVAADAARGGQGA